MSNKKRFVLNEVDGEKAFKLHQNIAEREKIRRALLVDNIKDVIEIHDSGGYLAILGTSDAKWTSYLAQIEVYYPRSRVELWRRILARFGSRIPEEKLISIPASRLEDLLTIDFSKTSKSFDDWVNSAETMISLDWKEEVRQAKGLPTKDVCKHEHLELYSICPTCGIRHKEDMNIIHGNTLPSTPENE